MKIDIEKLLSSTAISSSLGGIILFNSIATLLSNDKNILIGFTLIGGAFGLYIAYKSQVGKIRP
jgi:hypothetical protein